MHDKERFEFAYSPPRWPRVIALLFAAITLVALLCLPFDVAPRLLLVAASLMLLWYYWRILAKSPIEKVFFSDGLWYLQLAGNAHKTVVELHDSARPFQPYVILRFRLSPHRLLAVYVDANSIGEASFRAVCRRSIVEL